MKRRALSRRNPVAAAMHNAALKNRIVPARNRKEKRASNKLRQFLREYRNCRLYLAQASGLSG